MIDTKQKILDTAERLFGDHGYTATSLRQVIAEAEVNVAAVHYHFGSKEDLLNAVLGRKIGPLTEKRLVLLRQAEADAAGGPPDVEQVVAAFLMPTAQTAESNPMFVRLMGRMLNEGLLPQIAARHFRDSAAQFIAAFRRALPNLSQDELLWRVNFMVGALAHTLCGQPVLDRPEADFTLRLRRLTKFLAAGLCAPGEDEEIR
jgi:AcrR family transcriptional regulator